MVLSIIPPSTVKETNIWNSTLYPGRSKWFNSNRLKGGFSFSEILWLDIVQSLELIFKSPSLSTVFGFANVVYGVLDLSYFLKITSVMSGLLHDLDFLVSSLGGIGCGNLT